MEESPSKSSKDGTTSVHTQIHNLPRSIRWRIQMGLLHVKTEAEHVLADNQDWIDEQRQRYAQICEQHYRPFLQQEQGGGASKKTATLSATDAATGDLDPLTAMLVEEQAKQDRKQELELKFRKERALRKRRTGHSTAAEDDDDPRVYWSIIQKDLERWDQPQSHKETLKELLFCFATAHPDMGYRQGMHEVASYLLYAMQGQEHVVVVNHHNTHKQPNNDTQQQQDDDSSGHEDDIQKLTNHPSTTASMEYAAADTFPLLEATFLALRQAYDCDPDHSIAELGTTIVHDIHKQGRDDVLYHFLTSQCNNLPPPQLYGSQWLRLLFTRQVDDVYCVWDELYQHKLDNRNTMATCILLLQRDLLLAPNANGMHILLNLPLQKAKLVVETTRQLMTHTANLPLIVRNPIGPPPLVEPTPINAMTTTTKTTTRNVEAASETPPTLQDPLRTTTASLMNKMATAVTLSPPSNATATDAAATTTTPLRRPFLQAMRAGIDNTVKSTVKKIQQHQSNLMEPASQDPLLVTTTTTTSPPAYATASATQQEKWSHTIRTSVLTLQDYVIQRQANGEVVPSNIWDALADIEHVRLECFH